MSIAAMKHHNCPTCTCTDPVPADPPVANKVSFADFTEANDVGDEILLRGQPGKRSAVAPPDVAQAARAGDRIQGNAGELADEYGPIDEICASGCDVHLEQMGVDCFWLGLTRGTEELHLKIFKRGKSIHAEITHQEGFGLRAIAGKTP